MVKNTQLDTANTAISVGEGGTGDTTLTAYSVVCAGTTSTGVLQSVSGLGTAGQVLTSNGASALPTWQSAGGSGISLITTQVFTTAGVNSYNPTAGMLYCIVELVGAGGGGGGSNTSGSNVCAGGGGGAGGYAKQIYSAATIAPGQPVFIGTGGGGGSAATGSNGTGSTFGILGIITTAQGGSGGVGSSSSAVVTVLAGGAGGVVGSGGTVNTAGMDGGSSYSGFLSGTGTITTSGWGGSTRFGGGGVAVASLGGNGNDGIYGSGGSGSAGSSGVGGDGGDGFCIVTEFCS